MDDYGREVGTGTDVEQIVGERHGALVFWYKLVWVRETHKFK